MRGTGGAERVKKPRIHIDVYLGIRSEVVGIDVELRVMRMAAYARLRTHARSASGE